MISQYNWNSKIHGLYHLKYSSGEEEYALYENDKKRRQFSLEEVQRINAGTLDWTHFFRDPASRLNMIPNQSFEGPADWRARVDKLKHEVD